MERMNSELPIDIIEVIVSKLPFLNLPNCRLVCKAWNNLVLTCKFDPPVFTSNLFLAHISPYHNLHWVDFDPKHKHLEGINSVASFSFHPYFFNCFSISIINSCNGLLSLSIMKTREGKRTGPRAQLQPHGVCILNPMTNEYIKLPISKSDRTLRSYYFGLGFSPKTKQYKIARTRASNVCEHGIGTLVEIFTFGTSHGWTPIGFLPFFTTRDHGVYFNGSLYWVGDHRMPYASAGNIYRLDMKDEKVEKIPFYKDRGALFFLGVINGTLYLTICKDMLNRKYHVWKMEEDSSWIKVFVLAIPKDVQHIKHPNQPCKSYHLQLIKICEDGKILFLFMGLDLLLYDLKTERIEVLTNQDVEIKKHMWVHRIDSFNFNSFHNILAGYSLQYK